MLSTILEKEGPPPEGQRKRKSIGIDESTNFVCARCSSNPKCLVCLEEKVHEARKANGNTGERSEVGEGDMKPMEVNERKSEDQTDIAAPLLFRCWRCKQAAHYEHRMFPSPSLPLSLSLSLPFNEDSNAE